MPPHLKIRVPATSANLGPGFDGLGMALNLFNDFIVTPKESGANTITGRGTCEGIGGADNIFFTAFRRVCKLAGAPAPKIDVVVKGRIPVARGLGSSATAIVAGAMGANAILGSPLTPEELVLAMAQEEGHPDNVAPAFHGGLTASVFTGDHLFTHVYRPHPSWRVVLLIPGYQLSTEKARAAIPKMVPHRDAVFNLTRVPLVLDAILTGDAEELRHVLDDRLHEPYRKRLIKGYDTIRRAALDAGAAAVYLSGAGPSMAALCKGKPSAERVSLALAKSVKFGNDIVTLKPWPNGAVAAGVRA